MCNCWRHRWLLWWMASNSRCRDRRNRHGINKLMTDRKKKWNTGMNRIEAMQERIRRRSLILEKQPVFTRGTWIRPGRGHALIERNLPCGQCDFLAATPGALEMHIKLHHSHETN